MLQSPPPKEFNKRNEFDGYIDIGKELAVLHNLMTENLPRVNQKVSNICESLCIYNLYPKLIENKFHVKYLIFIITNFNLFLLTLEVIGSF